MIKEVAAMAKIESHNTLEKILENGIIAISRGNYGDTLLRAVDAAARGGIKAVEITFEQNLAPEIAGEALDKLVRRFGTVLAVGAGTVLTLEQLSIAAQAGAKYIVSPNSDCYIIKETKRRGLISIPGAMTPTEITGSSCGRRGYCEAVPRRCTRSGILQSDQSTSQAYSCCGCRRSYTRKPFAL